MNHKAFRSLLVAVIIGFVASSIGAGCANIIPPTGGPRDSIPPLLVAVTPKDSSENFNAKKVTFYFNEFVVVDNVHDNLVVSPVPKQEPLIEYKLRTVTIKIKDTLEENTTYAYDFGNAIKDNNEGNILKNFTYVFSTGAHIDSLELSGQVLIAQTGGASYTIQIHPSTHMITKSASTWPAPHDLKCGAMIPKYPTSRSAVADSAPKRTTTTTSTRKRIDMQRSVSVGMSAG